MPANDTPPLSARTPDDGEGKAAVQSAATPSENEIAKAHLEGANQAWEQIVAFTGFGTLGELVAAIKHGVRPAPSGSGTPEIPESAVLWNERDGGGDSLINAYYDAKCKALLICADAVRIGGAPTGSGEREAALEEAAKICEAEPELPGEPDDMMVLLNDPTQTLRAVVRVTKRNIAAGIRALAATPTAPSQGGTEK